LQWLTRSEETVVSDNYPGARPIGKLIENGIIILDKPPGPTSHQVDAWVKQILKIDKCSHGGTLDPRVSGVLVIALKNATKLMPILLSSPKEYVALMHIHKEVPEQDVRKVLNEFVGRIKQIPPQRAAVARRERLREIYFLEVLEISGRDVVFRVGCEAGTYIRKLIDDIGKRLGVGAHMQELRRVRSGPFTEDKVVTLQQLIDAVAALKEGDEDKLREVVHPLELVANAMKSVVVKSTAIANILNGAPLAVGGLARIQKDIETGDWVAMLGPNGQMLAFGKAVMSGESMARTNKGLAVKTDRVLVRK
jgi:H/ACA ribonucleoprotein complex subunit 4